MTIKILVPKVFARFAEGKTELEVEAGSVHEALTQLVSAYPALKEKLYSADNQLRQFTNVFVNQSDIRNLQREQTPLQQGDRVALIPAIAGG